VTISPVLVPVGMALYSYNALKRIMDAYAHDLPLHREDAHRHFFPFSDWRFTSPVSYWDPDHYGGYAAIGEVVLVLAVSFFLFRAYRGRGRWIVLGVAGVYALFIGFAVLIWSGL